MKSIFNSLDIACCVFELQQLIGFRVNQIYDVDHKTYLLKLHDHDNKQVLLIESGVRFHITTSEWPKNQSPSGFTMKLRKHLKNKRIESIRQLGNDRIVDFQFGSGEAAYHIFLELFNRGNIILTDCNLIAMNVLTPHTEGDRYKFTVKEPYPISRARETSGLLNVESLREIFKNAKPGDKINKVLLRHIDYGSALLEHVLTLAGFDKSSKVNSDLSIERIELLVEKLRTGEEIFNYIKSNPCKGYIIQKEEPRINQENLVTYVEFHPFLFLQHENSPFSVFDTFNMAIDEFFSKCEGQKLELRALKMERDALQRVEKLKESQQQRVENLILSQDVNKRKGELIMANNKIVDEIIRAVRKALALQMSWPAIMAFFNSLAKKEDSPTSIYKLIQGFKFEKNMITLGLSEADDDSSDLNAESRKTISVDIDLDLSAHSNASRYFSFNKMAAVKERKTIESQDKAVKSAERKAKLSLKDMKTMPMITKARKVYWFEKFYWFISSDNYLVIGGRDQQQNELIVKRYLKKGDIYVHADLYGASSIVIKNPTGNPIPPRTLNEAGNMAVCYSVGWDAKVMYSAYWVNHNQVSKMAPTGEYLTTGSFMIRGQKNYLLPAQLALGFGFLFKLEESSLFRHTGERRPKTGGALDDEILDSNSESVENPVKEDSENIPMNQTDTKPFTMNGLEKVTLDRNICKTTTEHYADIAEDEFARDSELIGLPDDVNKSLLSEKTKKEILRDLKNFYRRRISNDSQSSLSSGQDKPSLFNERIFIEGAEYNLDEIVSSSSGGDEIEADIGEDEFARDSELIGLPDDDVNLSLDFESLLSEKTKNATLKEENFYRWLISNDSQSSLSIGQDISIFNEETCDDIVESGQPTIESSMKNVNISKRQTTSTDDQSAATSSSSSQIKGQQPIIKRGQRSKMKKIKGKYKDQDEEEKRLRMSILKSDGVKKEPKKSKKNKQQAVGNKNINRRENRPKQITTSNREEEIVDEDEDLTFDELDIIDFLTGIPHPEDELLFAIPVVAPYATLLNYKYKVKMIPGNGKRGKSARAAVDYFLKTKLASNQEKALIKNVNDNMLSRNFPGKVKITYGVQKK